MAAAARGPGGWALAPPVRLPPLIFLDVDGVLHNVSNQGVAHFAPECMVHLRTICEATGAVICLSSMWQALPAQRAEVNEALRRWGLLPMMAVTVSNGNPGSGAESRAREILSWVHLHPEACAFGWVCLDDLDLMSVAPPPTFAPILPPGHHIHVNGMTGLTGQDAVRAIEILGGPNPRAPPLAPPLPERFEPFRAVPARQANGTTHFGHDAWKNDVRYGSVAAVQQNQNRGPFRGPKLPGSGH